MIIIIILKKCSNCNKILSYNKRKNIFCDIKCKKEFNYNKKDDKEKYKFMCKFNFVLSDYPNEFDFELIKKIWLVSIKKSWR